ncbi:MAG: Rab family GTPase [Promethearchaeota archaeon]
MSAKKEYRHDFIFKIVVIGDGAVGKTSLIKRYTHGSFNEEYIKTLGAQFSRYELICGENNDIRARLFFWDIAGQSNEFSFMRATFYNGARAVIIVFDLTRPETLDSVMEWYEDVSRYCGHLPTVLFGNKSDLVGETVPYDEEKREAIMKKYNILKFYRTSAKTGEHVHEAFNSIIDTLVKNTLEGRKDA